jgi:hypothetical protein
MDGLREWLEEEIVVADVGGVNDEVDVWRLCEEEVDRLFARRQLAGRFRLSSEAEAVLDESCRAKQGCLVGEPERDASSRPTRLTVCCDDGAVAVGVA